MDKRIYGSPLPEELAKFLIEHAEKNPNRRITVYPEPTDNPKPPRGRTFVPFNMRRLGILPGRLLQEMITAASVVTVEP